MAGENSKSRPIVGTGYISKSAASVACGALDALHRRAWVALQLGIPAHCLGGYMHQSSQRRANQIIQRGYRARWLRGQPDSERHRAVNGIGTRPSTQQTAAPCNPSAQHAEASSDVAASHRRSRSSSPERSSHSPPPPLPPPAAASIDSDTDGADAGGGDRAINPPQPRPKPLPPAPFLFKRIFAVDKGQHGPGPSSSRGAHKAGAGGGTGGAAPGQVEEGQVAEPNAHSGQVEVEVATTPPGVEAAGSAYRSMLRGLDPGDETDARVIRVWGAFCRFRGVEDEMEAALAHRSSWVPERLSQQLQDALSGLMLELDVETTRRAATAVRWLPADAPERARLGAQRQAMLMGAACHAVSVSPFAVDDLRKALRNDAMMLGDALLAHFRLPPLGAWELRVWSCALLQLATAHAPRGGGGLSPLADEVATIAQLLPDAARALVALTSVESMYDIVRYIAASPAARAVEPLRGLPVLVERLLRRHRHAAGASAGEAAARARAGAAVAAAAGRRRRQPPPPPPPALDRRVLLDIYTRRVGGMVAEIKAAQERAKVAVAGLRDDLQQMREVIAAAERQAEAEAAAGLQRGPSAAAAGAAAAFRVEESGAQIVRRATERLEMAAVEREHVAALRGLVSGLPRVVAGMLQRMGAAGEGGDGG